MRVAKVRAPVVRQTGTGVAADNMVPWAGRTITGMKGEVGRDMEEALF